MTSISRAAGGLWRRKRVILAASSTLDADSIKLAFFLGVKYVLHFRNETEDVYKTIELLSTRSSGDELEDNVTGNLGDPISVSTNVVVDGTDVVLRLTNNESYELKVSISKLITS